MTVERARILFVDDEPAVLDGLRNLLRKERHVWDMVFAVGADDALAHLDKGPFDVVVTDMRMPKIDGAELLARVKERHPKTTRVILSGHAGRDALARAAEVADCCLAKPCDSAVLRATLVDAITLARA